MARPIFLLLLFILPISLFAQEFLFKNISNELNIPSSECYNVFQDSRNYIWFSTEAGLCRFNGSKIKIFNEENGLPEKACYGICENPRGHLWFITSKNRLLYYAKDLDELVELPFTNSIANELKKVPTSQIYSIQCFNDSTLWINAQWNSFVCHIKKQKIEVSTPNDNGEYEFVLNETGLFPIKIASPKYANNHNGKKIILNFNSKHPFKYGISWENNEIPQWRCLTVKNNKGEYFIGWDNYLFKIYPNNSVESVILETSIISLYCSRDNDLWLGTLKKGLIKFENSELTDPIKSLTGLSVTGIIKDHENGIWCTTLEKGIFYCKNEEILSYSFTDNLKTKQELFKSLNNSIFSTSNQGEILKFNPIPENNYSIYDAHNLQIRDIEEYDGGYLLIGYKGLVWTDNHFKTIKYYKETRSSNYKGGIDISINSEKRVFFIQNGALFELENNNIISRIASLPQGATCLESNLHDLYLGTKNGLYFINPDNFNPVKIKNVTGSVSSILKLKNNTFIAITKDNGIYEGENLTFESRTKKYKLEGLRLFDIEEDTLGHLWIASNKGLIKIDKSQTEIYNHFDGLPTDEVFNVAVSNRNIYFNTNEGVFKFTNNNQLKVKESPKIYLNKLLVNSNPASAKNNQDIFQYYQNSFLFEFDVLTFKNTGSSKLIIELKGDVDTSFILNSNRLVLSKLDPGKYNLKVYGLTDYGIRSKIPFVFSFQIEKPFWKKTEFIILFYLILTAIIVLIIYLISKKIKRNENKKTQLNRMISEYQLTALQSQMNPHFIFNAINSIQTFILDNETQEAYNYLARFAKLIRMVLNQAKEKFISLDSEIELLKIYIELEQLRFKNKFDFMLSQDDEIDTSLILIPPLLLQPFIENAIWHGLMPLNEKTKGKLSIEIRKLEEGILIIIEDNGIGREESKRLKSDLPHSSAGLKLTQGRLEILNSISDSLKAEIKIIDLTNVDKKPSGTRVEIKILNPHDNND